MMKLNSYFKKCPVVTCIDGWVQGSDKGVAFLEYLPQAARLTFAVDAKAFIEALKILDITYRIIAIDEGIMLFDSEQEVTLLSQPAEISIKSKKPTTFTDGDFTVDLARANEFTTPDYPGIRSTFNYLEVVTSECVVRVSSTFELESKIILAYNLPKHSEGFTFEDDFLWLRYSKTCFVALSYLSVFLPSTSNLFNNWGKNKLIPIELYKKLSPAQDVKFTDRGLHLITPKIADTVLENIVGKGLYTYSYFNKLIKYGQDWEFTNQTLNITGNNFKAVLENRHA